MDVELNHIELDVAKEIISIGLAKSADSLSFFTKTKTIIKVEDFTMSNEPKPVNLSVKEDPVCVLTTHILGELKGVCYLIFSQNEVRSIMEKSLPESILNDPEKYKMMSEGMMLEIDNIVSAAVVTQFSNHFDYKTHGGVPSIKFMTVNQMKDMLSENVDECNYVLNFKTLLISDGVGVNADFIWSMDYSFIEGVKKYIKKNKQA